MLRAGGDLQGRTVHLGLDATTVRFLEAARKGHLPGFIGRLDDTGDALVNLDGDVFEKAFGANLPNELLLSYVVFDPQLEVQFVSNTFRVDFQ